METFGDMGRRLGREEFIGRGFELAYFRSVLSSKAVGAESIFNVHGTGGIGKTSLLTRFRLEAQTQGCLFIQLNMREIMGNTSLFIQALAAGIGLSAEINGRKSEQIAFLIKAMYAKAGGMKTVLAFDQYEEVGSIDQWLRESFLPQLRSDTVLIISGRYPLRGPWKLSTLWRSLIVPIPLAELSYIDVRGYLQNRGIRDELLIDRLWLATSGHPLSLALLSAEVIKERSRPFITNTRSSLEELLHYWLREVPGEQQQRELVYTASVPRFFDQDLLQAIFGSFCA